MENRGTGGRLSAHWPGAAIPLTGLAAVVAYSRVHTGVHYPGDVIAGSVTGAALAPIATAALERRRARRSGATG